MIKEQADIKRTPTAFIGNAKTKEVHHSGSATEQCHLKKITVTNKRVFQDLDEARESGFDLCGHCFKSLDNQ